MVTRKALFEQFSYDNGDSFYIAHNNASFCTAFQLLESLVGLPMTLSFEMGSILNIEKQAKNGFLRSSDLAFKPSELFPSIYLENKLKALEIKIFHEALPLKTFLVPANRQIRQVLSEYLRWPVLKQLIISEVLKYEVVEEKMFTVVGTEYVQQQTKIPYKIRKGNGTNELIENNLMLFEAAGGNADIEEVLESLRTHLKKNKFKPKPKKRTPKKKIKPKSPTTLQDSTEESTLTGSSRGTPPNRTFLIRYANFGRNVEVIEQFDEGETQLIESPDLGTILNLIIEQILHDFVDHKTYYKKKDNEWYLGKEIKTGIRGAGITIEEENEIRSIWQLSWVLDAGLTRIVEKEDYTKLINAESAKRVGQTNPNAPTTTTTTTTTTTQNNGTTPNNEEELVEDNESEQPYYKKWWRKRSEKDERKSGELVDGPWESIPAAVEIKRIIKDARQQLKVYEKDVTPRKVWKDIFKNKCTFDALKSKIAFKQYILQQHKYEPYQRVQYADIADVLKNCTI